MGKNNSVNKVYKNSVLYQIHLNNPSYLNFVLVIQTGFAHVTQAILKL